MTDTQASERRAFEAWYATIPPDQRPALEYALKINRYDEYQHRQAQLAWQGWLARSAIPIVVSEEMVNAAAQSICHYAAGPSDFNSCCGDEMGNKRCQRKARASLTAALSVSSGARNDQ